MGKDGQAVQSAADGENITVILKNNPFHAEGGGQIGDSGVLEGNSGIISIEIRRNYLTVLYIASER